MYEEVDAKHSVVGAIESLLNANHSTSNSDQMAHLLAVNLTQMVPRQQRALCSMLLNKRQCPLPLFEQMLIGEVDGIEHLVANAPWVGSAHAAAVLRHQSRPAVLRALARRSDLSIETQRALRDLNQDAVDRALELRQTGPVSKPVVEPSMPAVNLVDPIRGLSNAEFLQFLADANEPDASLLATSISDRFELDFSTVTSILSSSDISALASLIRFLGVQSAQAEQLYRSFRWRAYPTQEERGTFKAQFDALTDEAARRVVLQWNDSSAA